jgi:Tfp pilus assembly protein PilN
MQSVNLYLPEYRPQREWLSLEHGVIGLVAFLAVMLALQFHKMNDLRVLNQQVAALQQREAAAKQRVETLKLRIRKSEKERLQSQITDLQAAIANRSEIINVISSNVLGNRQGFSGHLFALGEKRVDELVVSHLVLNQGGQQVELQGTTRKPESVPLYVHRLQQSPEFAQAKFGILTIKEIGNAVQFRLGGMDDLNDAATSSKDARIN